MGLKVSNKNRKEPNKDKVALVFPDYLPQQKQSDRFLIWSTGMLMLIFIMVLFII